MVLISIRIVTLAILLVVAECSLAKANGPTCPTTDVGDSRLSPRAMALYSDFLERRGLSMSKLKKSTDETVVDIPLHNMPESGTSVPQRPEGLPREWDNVNNWEETAKSPQGRVHLLWLWTNASDAEKAKMPESLQLKMTTFYEPVYHYHKFFKNKPSQWEKYDELLWQEAVSVWPETTLAPFNHGEEFEKKWVNFKRWETESKKPAPRQYFIWRYLMATTRPAEMEKIPKTLQTTMRHFLGGSRALQRKLYMKYRDAPDTEWNRTDKRYVAEWQAAVTRASTEATAGSVPEPERVEDGQVKLSRKVSTRWKKMTGSSKKFVL